MRKPNRKKKQKVTNFFMSKKKKKVLKNFLKKIKKRLDKEKIAQYNAKCPMKKRKKKYIEK